MSEREFLVWDADEYVAPDDPEYVEDDTAAAWKCTRSSAEAAAESYARRHYPDDYIDHFDLVVKDEATGEVTKWSVSVHDQPVFSASKVTP